jgi:ABC-type molybdenum transport system ATPase subunit/photorepair protein PhrA
MIARPVLDVRALHIRRGETTILHNVIWHVKPGEHWEMDRVKLLCLGR